MQREVNVANNVKNKLVFNQLYYLYPKCTPTQLFQWRNLLQSYQDLLAHGRLRPRETRCRLMRLGKSLSETTSTFPNRLTPATSSAGTSEGRDDIQTSCFLRKQSILLQLFSNPSTVLACAPPLWGAIVQSASDMTGSLPFKRAAQQSRWVPSPLRLREALVDLKQRGKRVSIRTPFGRSSWAGGPRGREERRWWERRSGASRPG